MTDTTQTVVFISGVGRGIGNGLLQTYLQRDNHLVIGSVRDATSPQYENLKSLPTGSKTRLVLVSIESTSPTSATTAIQAAQDAAGGFSHIDLVISNAAIAPRSARVENVAESDMTAAFDVNVLGPHRLFKATYELLGKAKKPVWATISSAAGSVSLLEGYGVSPLLAYGSSKAAVNWLTVAIHASNPTWIATAIQPGFVSTDMGRNGSADLGVPAPPTDISESASKIAAFLDNATREKDSGILYDVMAESKLAF